MDHGSWGEGLREDGDLTNHTPNVNTYRLCFAVCLSIRSMTYRNGLFGCVYYICTPKLCNFSISSAPYPQTLLLDDKV